MDETYVKIKGKWTYLYRAVDKSGNTIDFLLSEKRDTAAATAFFAKSLKQSGLAHTVTIDKSGANKAGLKAVNLYLALLFMFGGIFYQIKIRQVKYLNNIVESDHRFIKKIIKPMMGFKVFYSAKATIAGIELHHMLRKGQHQNSDDLSIFEQFHGLAA
jgi:putative transposase